MRVFSIQICLWAAILVFPYAGYGQCCSGGVPISSSLGLASRGAGSLQFQLTYDYNALRDWFDGANRRQRPHSDPIRTTQSVLLESNYDVSNAFAVSALFSLVRQERFTPKSNSLTQNDGIGDAIILFKYNLFHRNTNSPFRLSAGLGPKLPLASNDFTDNDSGLLLPADLQPGTGAWEAISWTHLNYQPFMGSRPTFNLTSIITARYNFRGTRNNETQYYRFGQEVQFQLGASDRFVIGQLLFDPSVMFRYRKVGRDYSALVPRDPEAADPNLLAFPNTGGDYVFLSPSLGVNLNPDLSFRISGDLPLYRKLIGSQVTTSYKLSASIYYSLSLSKDKSPKLLPNSKF